MEQEFLRPLNVYIRELFNSGEGMLSSIVSLTTRTKMANSQDL